uniref:Immunoglobulin V-set domain-containing protein n=1 Tax=Anabas testudineus TaxID=64144 RepID=A0A7N6FG14_ANATE
FLHTTWMIIHKQYEIKAEPGEDVTLQCQDPRKVSIELIKWSKPDLKSEKYVYLFRDGSMYVSVILKNVNINDAGTYDGQTAASVTGKVKMKTELCSTCF